MPSLLGATWVQANRDRQKVSGLQHKLNNRPEVKSMTDPDFLPFDWYAERGQVTVSVQAPLKRGTASLR